MHFQKDWNQVTEETERILYYFEYLCALIVVLYPISIPISRPTYLLAKCTSEFKFYAYKLTISH